MFPSFCFRSLFDSFTGLEYIEGEVAEMMRGVDVDGSDSIEWEVRPFGSVGFCSVFIRDAVRFGASRFDRVWFLSDSQ